MVLGDLTTTAWLVLVIAGALLLMGFTKKGKNKAQGQTFLIIGAIGLAIVFFAPTIIPDFLGGTAGAGAGAVTPFITPTASGTICAVEDTTVTLSAIDKFDATSS